MKKQVLFVCIFNVKRSVIAEHLLRQSLNEMGEVFADAIEVSSAGFLGEEISKWFKDNNIPYPEPLYHRIPPDYILKLLLERGVDLSQHRSKPISKDILDNADLIIPLLDILKRDIVAAFPKYEGKIVLPREFIDTGKDFFWEDTSNVPNDGSMFEFAHNDPHYVNTVIEEIEEYIADASTSIINSVLFKKMAS